MSTIKQRLEQEKIDFGKALNGEFTLSDGKKLRLMNVQRKFVEDAIPSIDYMLAILNGDVVLPKGNENMGTSLGKAFCWMQGSIVNITMAETIVYCEWANVTDCFKCMYMNLADYVNELNIHENYDVGDDGNDDDEDYDDYLTMHPSNRCRDDVDCDEGICDCCDC